MIGWTVPFFGSYNFLTLPGGGAVAGSDTTSGNQITWVPLIDASGSTIALVNAASTQSPPATTYTYDPSGNPTLSDTANNWPFLYKGFEKEFTDPGPLYYNGAGQFYSPQLVRSLSEVGQTSSSGPGPSGNSIAAPSGGGQQSYWSWVGQQDANLLKSLLGPNLSFNINETSYYAPSGPIVQGIESLISFFDWLFGGSDNPPTPRQLRHGRHPLYGGILGIQEDLIPDEHSSAQKPKTPKPGRGGVPKTGVLRVFVETLPFQEVTPFESEAVPAPLDKAPYWFGRPVTFSRCLDAAEHTVLWENLCRDMPNSVLQRECWSLAPESVEKRRGFCKDLFTV